MAWLPGADTITECSSALFMDLKTPLPILSLSDTIILLYRVYKTFSTMVPTSLWVSLQQHQPSHYQLSGNLQTLTSHGGYLHFAVYQLQPDQSPTVFLSWDTQFPILFNSMALTDKHRWLAARAHGWICSPITRDDGCPSGGAAATTTIACCYCRP